jgi:hypothetical protein
MAPLHGGSSAGKSDLCCGRSLNVVGRPGLHQSGLMSTCFADCPSPGPRKNDLTIYWALGLFVRSFTLLVDPGDICPPQALYDKKGKAKQIQPPQDNTTAGVNKPVEGEIVICRLCHKEGHKSFQRKAKTGDNQKQKLKQKPTSKISNTYINKVDKKATTPYLIKKKKNGKMIAIKANKQDNKGKGTKRISVPKEIISTMKNTKKVWIPRRK